VAEFNLSARGQIEINPKPVDLMHQVVVDFPATLRGEFSSSAIARLFRASPARSNLTQSE
jgi:hypothetical protein